MSHTPAFNRRLMALLVVMLLAYPANAQHHLFGGDGEMRGFVGPVLKISAVDGATAVFLGGRGGMIVPTTADQGLRVGIGMYGMMTGVDAPRAVAAERDEHLRFGYAGLELAYAFRPSDIVHLSVGTLLGAGQAGFDDDIRGDGHGFGHLGGAGPALFVAEPGMNVSVNVSPFLRLGLGAGYRFVGAPASDELRGVNLSGWSGQVALQLGRF